MGPTSEGREGTGRRGKGLLIRVGREEEGPTSTEDGREGMEKRGTEFPPKLW